MSDQTMTVEKRDPLAMTHQEVLKTMIGLLAGLFTALLSTTIVATALPTIIGDLKGSQTAYAWVITTALLANAASTPIWGKLADIFNKKVLVQSALVIFVAGSILAGLRAQRADPVGGSRDSGCRYGWPDRAGGRHHRQHRLAA